MAVSGDRIAVLLAAAGASWESEALRTLGEAGLVVLKRCVDLADLLASAASGQADVALVSSALPGLDAASVTALLRNEVRVVAVGDEGLRSLSRIGIGEVVDPAAVSGLPDLIRRTVAEDVVADPEPDPELPTLDPAATPGRVLAVWGPAGAPGRTTVAVSVAAELARRGRTVVLADLDPYGGSVAQHLGVLDEVSGLLAAARLANAGELDDRRFATTRRLVGERLEVLTGLPRADRWIEVRDGVVAELLERSATRGEVVVDTGFCLEESPGDVGRRAGGRNRMTLETFAAADEVVVVGSADPIGLTRLARALVELAETAPMLPLRVVVNRMRDTLGWREADIRGMVEGFARPLSVHFLPDDRATCDRALVVGEAMPELGDSPLRRALSDLVDRIAPEPTGSENLRGASRRRRRRRRRR